MVQFEPVTTLEQAGLWIARVGLGLAFPQARVPLPSLWAAAHGYTPDPGAAGWDETTERMWAWKDQMAEQKMAWYGALVAHKPTFVAPDLLPLLMALRPSLDAEQQWQDGLLSQDAWRVVQALGEGAQGRLTLRSKAGMVGKEGGARFTRAMESLEQALLVARVGVRQEGGNWPSTAYTLIGQQWPEAVKRAQTLTRAEAAQRVQQRLRAFLQAVGTARAARLLGLASSDLAMEA